MSQDRIKEICSEIERLKAEVSQLRLEETAAKLKLEWIKPGVYMQYDFLPTITGYMKVMKVEPLDEDNLKVCGKRVIIKHKDLSTQVSFNSYDEFDVMSIASSEKLKEISEEEWNETLSKAKDFVQVFE